jgi:hypothetical protein
MTKQNLALGRSKRRWSLLFDEGRCKKIFIWDKRKTGV